MTATQHPISRAIETLMVAIQGQPLLEERLTDVATEVARLCRENVRLARENMELAADALAMEKLDEQRVAVITELRKQLNHEAGLPASLAH